jgi:hypothetical protein
LLRDLASHDLWRQSAAAEGHLSKYSKALAGESCCAISHHLV